MKALLHIIQLNLKYKSYHQKKSEPSDHGSNLRTITRSFFLFIFQQNESLFYENPPMKNETTRSRSNYSITSHYLTSSQTHLYDGPVTSPINAPPRPVLISKKQRKCFAYQSPHCHSPHQISKQEYTAPIFFLQSTAE